MKALNRLLRGAVDVREHEVPALLWSCAYFFFVLSSYYILRPVRDEAGVAGGVDNLPWLFTGTLVGMLIAHPIFAALVTRLPRRRFVPFTYRFFMLNVVAFYLLFQFAPEWNVWVGRGFFVWLSVFNLFVVSVFWSYMADTWMTEQGKRLFGFIAVGGTAGAVLGSSVPAFLAVRLGTTNLMIISIVVLELAVQAVRRLGAVTGALVESAPRKSAGESDGAIADVEDRSPGESPGGHERQVDDEVIGGGVFAGVRHSLSSPYLLGIVAYMLMYTIASTFLYFQQAEVVGAAFVDRAQRTAVFGRIDLAVNVLTVLTQVFFTGRILRLLGVGLALAVLPVVTIIGFGTLGIFPALAVIIGFQVLRRTSNFALARPSREVLYTVLSREDKYKAKNFIDTFVYRAGDQVGAWSYAAMGWLGLTLSGLALSMVPVGFAWLGTALWLGRKQKDFASAGDKT